MNPEPALVLWLEYVTALQFMISKYQNPHILRKDWEFISRSEIYAKDDIYGSKCDEDVFTFFSTHFKSQLEFDDTTLRSEQHKPCQEGLQGPSDHVGVLFLRCILIQAFEVFM